MKLGNVLAAMIFEHLLIFGFLLQEFETH